MAVLTAERLFAERRKCSTRTIETSAMSRSGYASESAARGTLPGAPDWAVRAALARARLQDRVSSEPPMSQESRPRQTHPARVTGRLARTSRPTMAGGAKQRKAKSASEGSGTFWPRTTSYQPQTAFPRPPMSEEKANISQAGRSRRSIARA